MLNYDRFSHEMRFLKIIGHHVTPSGNFIFFQSGRLRNSRQRQRRGAGNAREDSVVSLQESGQSGLFLGPEF